MVENGNVCIFREGLSNDVELLARGFALRVFFHGIELPGNVCHYCVGIVSSPDTRRGEETVGQTVEVGLCKHDRRVCLDDVRVEISS